MRAEQAGGMGGGDQTGSGSEEAFDGIHPAGASEVELQTTAPYLAPSTAPSTQKTINE